VVVTPAGVTDRDAARELLTALCLEHPEITQVWADQGYSGELVAWAKDTLGLLPRISKKPPGQVRFNVVPRRWIVERSLSWITQARRLVRDHERLPRHAEVLGQLDRHHPDDRTLGPRHRGLESRTRPRPVHCGRLRRWTDTRTRGRDGQER
jgi:transposase